MIWILAMERWTAGFPTNACRQGLEPTDLPTPFSGSAEMTVAFQEGTWQLIGFRVYNIY